MNLLEVILLAIGIVGTLIPLVIGGYGVHFRRQIERLERIKKGRLKRHDIDRVAQLFLAMQGAMLLFLPSLALGIGSLALAVAILLGIPMPGIPMPFTWLSDILTTHASQILIILMVDLLACGLGMVLTAARISAISDRPETSREPLLEQVVDAIEGSCHPLPLILSLLGVAGFLLHLLVPGLLVSAIALIVSLTGQMLATLYLGACWSLYKRKEIQDLMKIPNVAGGISAVAEMWVVMILAVIAVTLNGNAFLASWING